MTARALVIADSASRLAALRAALEGGGWQVRGFVNAKDALQAMLGEPFEAVFCDTFLAGASGGGFLAWSRRHAPERPFYLIDNGGARPRGFAPDGVLDFPLRPGAVPPPAPPKAPPEKVPPETVPPDAASPAPSSLEPAPAAATSPRPAGPYFSGNTSLVPLSDLVAMIGLAGHAVLVRLKTPGGEGRLYLEGGRVLHAELRPTGAGAEAAASGSGASGDSKISGFEALARLMAEEGCDFSVQAPEPSPERSIGLSAAGAMTEAARLADERRRYGELLTRLRAACPSLDSAAIGYALGKTPYLCDGDPAFFGEAREMFEALRRVAGSKLQDLSLTVGERSVVVQRFGEDQLLTARGPLAERVRLPQLVRHVLQGKAAPRQG